MEWYYIVAIIISSLGSVGYIVNRVNNLVRDTKNNTNEIEYLKNQVTDISKNFSLREKSINSIELDIKMINQKFDIYIKQLIELNKKADLRISALEKHTQSCIFANKKLSEIKELVK